MKHPFELGAVRSIVGDAGRSGPNVAGKGIMRALAASIRWDQNCTPHASTPRIRACGTQTCRGRLLSRADTFLKSRVAEELD
jgi:hypothetical protein